MTNTYKRDGKTYRKVVKNVIYEQNGKKYLRVETVEEEVKPIWNDGWRNSHPCNPTEQAPSFRRR